MADSILKYLSYVFYFVREWLCLCKKGFGNIFKSFFHRQRNRKITYETLTSDEEDYNSDGEVQTQTHGLLTTTGLHKKKVEQQCYICLESIRCPSVIKLLSCTHNDKFHVACLGQWIIENSVTDFPLYGVFNVSCPICRKSKTVQVRNVSRLNDKDY